MKVLDPFVPTGVDGDYPLPSTIDIGTIRIPSVDFVGVQDVQVGIVPREHGVGSGDG